MRKICAHGGFDNIVHCRLCRVIREPRGERSVGVKVERHGQHHAVQLQIVDDAGILVALEFRSGKILEQSGLDLAHPRALNVICQNIILRSFESVAVGFRGIAVFDHRHRKLGEGRVGSVLHRGGVGLYAVPERVADSVAVGVINSRENRQTHLRSVQTVEHHVVCIGSVGRDKFTAVYRPVAFVAGDLDLEAFDVRRFEFEPYR
ncbi:MAG: GMC family oxidoreductase N-terminal domain-containing protein, partial [Clostridia bacterium]|nr:GMC family oxidoreductase N-terminal domain-containing protein [Clostridia bacterium]